eukprot:15469990-Alexandrium_andersonii.AAC.1
MSFLGLLTVTWGRFLRLNGGSGTVQVLADDLMLASGMQGRLEPDQLAVEHDELVEQTFAFFESMGAKVPDEKCKTMVTHSETKSDLKGRRYGREQQAIPIVGDLRDLGSHLSVGNRAVAPTLTARLKEATGVVRR